INTALNSHFIDINGHGIESDDYQQFLRARAEKIFTHLKSRIELTRTEPANEEIEELIFGGESEFVEFKSTLRYDLHQKKVNKTLEYVIAKTISAFLNSNGGNLFIGIDDNQNALGLSDDIGTLKKQDIDGFELQVVEIIKKYIGKEFSSHIKINFPEYDGKKICRISVSESSRPIFVRFEGKEDFFIRSGCSSQPLNREEQSVYEKEHWS
ncbi:MAG: ATP-binding protein, partial [Desulfatibacillum sp.]|nr:ATP-binding protein [Desulfatibacillum sp.]